jgi:hypothetical protein
VPNKSDMPTTAEAHRTCTGTFHPILLSILKNKTEKYTGHAKQMNHRRVKNVLSELFSWIVCVSLSVLYCVSVLLLARCMDVELNPGPVDNPSFVHQMHENLERCFPPQAMQFIHAQFASLSQQMTTHFEQLGQFLHRLEGEIKRLKTDIKDNRTDISKLQQDSVGLHGRLERLEKEAEKTNIVSREKNLKLFGIYEPTPSDNWTDKEEIVGTLNHFSRQKRWQTSDITATYRIGTPTNRQQGPRPLIVTFHSTQDKVAILTDRELRNSLRGAGIRVASDLTPRQRDQVQFYRDQGKQAFFRNGRLIVDDSESGQPRGTGHLMNPSDWPALDHSRKGSAQRTYSPRPSPKPDTGPRQAGQASSGARRDGDASPHPQGPPDWCQAWHQYANYYKSLSNYNMMLPTPTHQWMDYWPTNRYQSPPVEPAASGSIPVHTQARPDAPSATSQESSRARPTLAPVAQASVATLPPPHPSHPPPPLHDATEPRPQDEDETEESQPGAEGGEGGLLDADQRPEAEVNAAAEPAQAGEDSGACAPPPPPPAAPPQQAASQHPDSDNGLLTDEQTTDKHETNEDMQGTNDRATNDTVTDEQDTSSHETDDEENVSDVEQPRNVNSADAPLAGHRPNLRDTSGHASASNQPSGGGDPSMPMHARDARPKTRQNTATDLSSRTTRSNSRPNAHNRANKQATLHQSWPSPRSKTNK